MDCSVFTEHSKRSEQLDLETMLICKAIVVIEAPFQTCGEWGNLSPHFTPSFSLEY
jgi:hypothetical protein